MGARDLLAELADLGVTVTADGDKLVIRPASKLTDDLRAALRAHKAELLAATSLAAPEGHLATIARRLPPDTRQVLDCMLWIHTDTGGLQARQLAEAARLPVGLVLGALDLLLAAGLASRSRGYWSPSAALRRELQAAECAKTSATTRGDP
jgi:citrate lyase beta subunit